MKTLKTLTDDSSLESFNDYAHHLRRLSDALTKNWEQFPYGEPVRIIGTHLRTTQHIQYAVVRECMRDPNRLKPVVDTLIATVKFLMDRKTSGDPELTKSFAEEIAKRTQVLQAATQETPPTVSPESAIH